MNLCWIYKSPRKDEMYLYLSKENDFEEVPDTLLERFGKPISVMSLNLTSERKLARVDVNVVIANLKEHGFHLQMPPNLVPDMYHGNED